MKLKKSKILATLLFSAFLLRVLTVFITPIKWWDETVYANLGWDLKSNPLDYSFARKWSDYVPGDWPKAGFRAPLLPYTLAGVYTLTSSQILIDLFMPFIGVMSLLLLYLFAKHLFDEEVALHSLLFLLLLPLHVFYSGKILTDVFGTFFLILSALFFWLGFEKRMNEYKLLFGFSMGLSLLARYTALWVIPTFPIYLLLRQKNVSFLRDKFLWYCLGIFLLTLTPWFFYGISEYNNPFGAILHAKKAAGYWGGAQPWYFYLEHSLSIFSILPIIFVLSIIFLIHKKKIKNPQIMFLLLWFFTFLFCVTLTPHKEERFLLPITPPLVILSALFTTGFKKYSKLILILIIVSTSISLVFSFYSTIQLSYTSANQCFLEANKFITGLEDNSLIITDQSPLVYFYTKKETHFYPSPFELPALQNLVNTYYKDRPVYILWSEYDMPLSDSKNKAIKEMMDLNLKIVYECSSNKKSMARIYKFSEKLVSI